MILLPLALAAVTAGCSTLSDSDVVARVNDVELTGDEFDARLIELGVDGAEVIPLEPVRAELTRWIQQQLVPADEIAAIYDAGAAEAGVVCVSAIVVTDQEAADVAVDDIESGTDFIEVFQRDNLDQSLLETNGSIPCISAADLDGSAGTPFIDAAAALSSDKPTGSAMLLDDAGAEIAWVVLVFRSWAELDSVDAEQATGLIDVSAFATDADVYVDSRYGTFDAATGSVVSLN